MTNIKSSGPTLLETDIVALEQRLDVQIPAAFRAFLLKFNGGRPVLDTVDVPGLAGSPTDVKVIFGIGRSVETSNVEWKFRVLAERLRGLWLPVASDSLGGLFAVALRAPDFGSVYFLDLGAVFGDLSLPTPEYLVAGDFDEFLSRLRGPTPDELPG